MDTELLTDGEKLASIDLIEAATSEAWRRAMAAACESNYKLGFISQNYFLVSKKNNSKNTFASFEFYVPLLLQQQAPCKRQSANLLSSLKRLLGVAFPYLPRILVV